MQVSVILPFCNSEQTLQRAIQSILDQTLPGFELILIDNNSTDRSTKIAEQALIDDRVRLLHEPQQGVVFTANRGLSAATGKYTARMDADDWSFPDRLYSQARLLDENLSIDLVSGIVEYGGDKPNEGFSRYLRWINSVSDSDEIYLNQFVEYPIVNPSIMFRRELVEKFGHYREGNFPEDYEFFLRLQQSGVRMKKVSTPVLKWSDLPNRLSRTHPNYSKEAFDRIKAMYLIEWLKSQNPYHPDIWVWGSGKKARQKGELLTNEGIIIRGFIDVSGKQHSGDLPVVHFEMLPDKPDRFIISFAGNWDSRSRIRQFLKVKGWKEGIDFILAA